MKIYKTTMKNGLEITFEEVYKNYYHSVFAYFMSRIGNKADAEDLTSEVFVYCCRQFDTYNPEKASLATWIYLVAKSRFSNYCRDRKVTENIDDFTDIAGETGEFMEKSIYLTELRNQLNSALTTLSERQRQIVVLKYFEEKSTEEIADLLQTSSNNIRVQLSKALKKMQLTMKDWR